MARALSEIRTYLQIRSLVVRQCLAEFLGVFVLLVSGVTEGSEGQGFWLFLVSFSPGNPLTSFHPSFFSFPSLNLFFSLLLPHLVFKVLLCILGWVLHKPPSVAYFHSFESFLISILTWQGKGLDHEGDFLRAKHSGCAKP